MGRLKLTLIAALATFLGSTALWPLFKTSHWPYIAFLIIALVAASGWGCGRLRVPALLTPLVSAAIVLLTLTGLYTRADALFLAIPTPTSLAALGDLFEAAMADVARYATPAPETPPLMVLTISGVALVAILVDLLAVRLRMPAIAGLPLLALYSVSAGILQDGPNWFIFVLGGAGYLGMLLADNRERLARWGRPVWVRRPWDRRPSVGRQTADTGSIGSLGRRIGVTAVVVAVAVPAFVPLTDHAFFGGNGSGTSWWSRFGAPTLRAQNPVVSMRRELLKQSDEVFFRYKTSSKRPPYLRTVALTNFNGVAWTPGKLRGLDENRVETGETLSTPAGADVSTMDAVRTTVRVEADSTLHFLPVPYAPERIRAPGVWYHDPRTMSIFSTSGVAFSTRRSKPPTYTVVSEVQRPRPTQLDAALDPGPEVKPYLQLPDNLPAQVKQKAKRVTAGKKTAYQQAVALQTWFTQTGGFSYSTKPAGDGNNALLAFLRDRVGYCQQYASAMAVMARSLGIPSRVAVGFTQGTRVGKDTWAVRGRDAHAWPELWFEGVGWIRFEPTPAGAGGQATAIAPGYSKGGALSHQKIGGQDLSATPPDSAVSTKLQRPPDQRRRQLQGGGSAAGGGGGGGSGLGADVGYALLALLILAFLLALLPAAGRSLIRHRRWATARGPASVADVAWLELTDDATDLAVPPRGNESPRAYATRLRSIRELPAPAVEALDRVALAEEHARYAPEPETPDTLRADVRTVRAAIGATTDRRTRWRASLLPRSVVRRLPQWRQRAGARYDRAHSAVGRSALRLVPSRRPPAR